MAGSGTPTITGRRATWAMAAMILYCTRCWVRNTDGVTTMIVSWNGADTNRPATVSIHIPCDAHEAVQSLQVRSCLCVVLLCITPFATPHGLFREQPLDKQGGRIFLGPEYFFRNTLKPRNLFRVIWSQYFLFYKFYNCNFQTTEPDFFL